MIPLNSYPPTIHTRNIIYWKSPNNLISKLDDPQIMAGIYTSLSKVLSITTPHSNVDRKIAGNIH